MTEAMQPCCFCGMPCAANEYHPYAACLMFKACQNAETVRANLDDVRRAAPTHAQAGAVPLDEARRLFDAGWKAAALFCDREDVVADGIIGFGAFPQFEAAFSAANGLKRGQHGPI